MIEQSVEELAALMKKNPKKWAEMYLTLRAETERLQILLQAAILANTTTNDQTH